MREWLKRRYRSVVHGLIRRYLSRCAGSFHTGPYGEDGRYIVLMSETGYHIFKNGPQDYGLMQIYRDDRGFFVALPGFSNPQASPIVRLDWYAAAGWLKELKEQSYEK